MPFTWQLRMCFQDVDAEGIVYHSRYLEFSERARTEWLVGMGIQNQEIMDLGVALVVHRVEMDFLAPARLDDLLTIDVQITELKNASTVIEQTITVDGQPKAHLKLEIVYVNTQTLRPTRIPAILKQAFENYIKENK